MSDNDKQVTIEPNLTETNLQNLATEDDAAPDHDSDVDSLTEDMLEKHNKDQSWRPKFIPLGYKEGLHPNIYKNLFYSTSSGDSYRNPIEHSRSSPSLLRDCRGLSVQLIHDHNRAAMAMPGGYKPSRAPLYQRTMCTYTGQFVPRPLDGVLINSECYKLFKDKCTTSATSSANNSAKLASETTTKASYPTYSQVESQKAIPPNFKPLQEKHVSEHNKLLVTKSAQHRQFSCPSVNDTKSARPEAFKPKYQTHRSVGTMSAISSYKRDYHSDKYNKLWPVKFARQNHPPGPCSGYTGNVCLDETKEKCLDPDSFYIGDVVTTKG